MALGSGTQLPARVDGFDGRIPWRIFIECAVVPPDTDLGAGAYDEPVGLPISVERWRSAEAGNVRLNRGGNQISVVELADGDQFCFLVDGADIETIAVDRLVVAIGLSVTGIEVGDQSRLG